MWKIKKSVLQDVLLAARNTYPNEFASLLGGDKKKKIITEFVVPPTRTDRVSSLLNIFAMPIDENIIGSFHSHPGPSFFPSKADKKFFQRYLVNGIACYPFSAENIAFYDNRGNSLSVEIVD